MASNAATVLLNLNLGTRIQHFYNHHGSNGKLRETCHQYNSGSRQCLNPCYNAADLQHAVEFTKKTPSVTTWFQVDLSVAPTAADVAALGQLFINELAGPVARDVMAQIGYTPRTRLRTVSLVGIADTTLPFAADLQRGLLYLCVEDSAHFDALVPANQLVYSLYFSALHTLEIDNCPFTDFRGLATAFALTTVALVNCSTLQTARHLATLPAMQNLTIQFCEHLASLQFVADCGSLKTLQVITCPHLVDISALSSLPALTTLELTDLPMLSCLAGLSNTEQRQTLTIIDCPRLFPAYTP
jgi:hypothetical protein